jgi:uncharacterized protein YndB with AHSA1/START domain
MKQAVKLDIFYPHPPERVWKALTDRRALATWMMESDFEPYLGHKFQFQRNNKDLSSLEMPIECEVVELDEPKCLAYTWRESFSSESSLVIWTLTAVEGGTQLQLIHQEYQYLTAVGSMMNRGLQAERSGKNMMSLAASRSSLVKTDSALQSFHPTESAEFSELIPNLCLKDQWEYCLMQKLPKTLLHYLFTVREESHV